MFSEGTTVARAIKSVLQLEERLGFLLNVAACLYLLPVTNKSQIPEKVFRNTPFYLTAYGSSQLYLNPPSLPQGLSGVHSCLQLGDRDTNSSTPAMK